MTGKIWTIAGNRIAIHRHGAWARSAGGFGPGWMISSPRQRPLFSERHGHGQRVVFRWRGWRLKRLDALNPVTEIRDVFDEIGRIFTGERTQRVDTDRFAEALARGSLMPPSPFFGPRGPIQLFDPPPGGRVVSDEDRFP